MRESNQIDRSPDDLLKYERFDEKIIKYLWRRDWWDGPINGSIEYLGRRYWFNFYCDTEEPGNPFYYLVYLLSEKEAEFADRWSSENERFRDEWCPLANSAETKDLPATKDIADRWKLHELTLPDYTKREPVAWFISGGNSSFYGMQVYPAEPDGCLD